MSKILMKDRNTRKNPKKICGSIAIAIILVVACAYITIAKSGHWLVDESEFSHAKWAVVLDGQTADLERNAYAADLLKEGMVDSVVILGRRVYLDKSNADYYAEDFMSRGSFDSSAIFLCRHDDPSSIAEARTIIPWLKSRKADTVILLTAASASRRVGRIFRTLAGESPVFLTANIKYFNYNPDSWLFHRESRKLWLHEWLAYANSKLDLMGVEEISAADSAYYKPIRSLKEEQDNEPIIDLQKLLPKAAADTAKIDTAKTSSAKKDSTKTDAAKADSTKAEAVKSDSLKKDSPKADSTAQAKK
ncbi:ElyC/SanA/YdcF family protein [Fibrobacter sp.]|uniref:ElyC/SanA/YdcF family protein n=1 Tax=Fibrobacter sp. TaxID=35828 RepID=UPI0038909886